MIKSGETPLIDLRSDFVGRPTEAMKRAMAEAADLPGAFGLREDPTQIKLEELSAKLVGKEDALFFPTCTMCNQTAIHIHSSPGRTVLAEAESHFILSEAGSPAALSGVMVRGLPGKKGFVEPDVIRACVEAGDVQRSRTALFVIENTHNRSGGSVLTKTQMEAMTGAAREMDVPVHLDGARVFNAAVALGVGAAELCAFADSVSFSLNKGLSAPMGAVLAGPREFISQALTVRQRLGGGWRPTGVLAAACVVALETMIDRLADDHRRALELARATAGCPGLFIDPASVQTNLILAKIKHPHKSTDQIVNELAGLGVLVLKFGPELLRLAVHWEIGPEEVQRAAEAFKLVFEQGTPA